MPIDVISLISDDESPKIPPPHKRPRTHSASTNLVTSTDDEVIIVSHKKPRANDLTTANRPTQINAGDEIECVGEERRVNVLADFPHFRFQCATLASPSIPCLGPNRPLFCPQCFCYVCDIPAAECQEWSSHEHAHDGTAEWRSKRREKSERRERLERNGNPSPQTCNAFMTSFGTSQACFNRRQSLNAALRRRRKAKVKKRSGSDKKRGRPR